MFGSVNLDGTSLLKVGGEVQAGGSINLTIYGGQACNILVPLEQELLIDLMKGDHDTMLINHLTKHLQEFDVVEEHQKLWDSIKHEDVNVDEEGLMTLMNKDFTHFKQVARNLNSTIVEKQ